MLLIIVLSCVFEWDKSDDPKKVEALAANENLVQLAASQMRQDVANGSFIQLQNGSFEDGHSNVKPGQSWKYLQNGQEDSNGKFFWEGYRVDTGAAHQMEVQNSMRTPQHGAWYAELNPDLAIGLSQDVATVPGVTVYWSLYYAKRVGTDERASVLFGPVPTTGINSDNILNENLYRQDVIIDNSPHRYLGDGIANEGNKFPSDWYRYEGTYVIPAGQTNTRFQFLSVVEYAPAAGNFLDDIQFASGAKVRLFNKYENDVTVVGKKTSHRIVVANSGGMSANNVQMEVQLPLSMDYSNEGVSILGSYNENGTSIANNCTVSNISYNSATHTLTFDVDEVRSLECIDFSVKVEAVSADNANVQSDDNAVAEINVLDYENASYGNRGVSPVDSSNDGIRIVDELDLEKNVDKQVGIYGEELTYSMTLENKNEHTGEAEDIVIEDVIPVGTEYVPGSLMIDGSVKTDGQDADGASFIALSNSVRFEIARLNATETMTLSFKVKATCISDIITNSADLSYQWREDVNNTEQTLTSNEVETEICSVLFHIRQVILSESEELVVPTEGYLRIKTNDFDQLTGTTTENTDQLRQVTIPSGTNTDNPPFETFVVDTKLMVNDLDELNLALILPEYYEQLGYYLTLAQSDNNGTGHQGKTEADITPNELVLNRADLDDDEEYFITIYLKPKLSQNGPQPYSWDYKKNDLGKIKTK
ncbi:DUF11 domain-containing protein [Enterococcus sp. AZ163]|uniref:DUF11 domain-containing protein n=1 Tax=Enterococcus sp. AZ163 TaxID=2774638 RepID=UPI003D26E8C2